jgi:hypothetical protein
VGETCTAGAAAFGRVGCSIVGSTSGPLSRWSVNAPTGELTALICRVEGGYARPDLAPLCVKGLV